MKRYLLLSFFIIVILIWSSCSAPRFTTEYQNRPQVILAEDIKSSQTIGDITIDLEPVNITEEYKKPFFTGEFTKKRRAAIGSDVISETHELPIFFYNKMAPFNVTIHNNTDHIIRMSDARIAYIDPNLEEPVFALQKDYIIDNVRRAIPTYQLTMKDIWEEFPLTDEDELGLDKFIINIVNQLRFINISEILPGMRASGTILFPVKPDDLSTGIISFIDMVSRTDAAGNPSERVRFDYRTDVFDYYYKYDPNSKNYVEITEEEYKEGQRNPETYIYDRRSRTWIKQ